MKKNQTIKQAQKASQEVIRNSCVPAGLGSIMKLSNARTFSLSAENVYGRKGCGGMAVPLEDQEDVLRIGQMQSGWNDKNGHTLTETEHPSRELGQKWKVRPAIGLMPGTTTTIADISESGIIQHMWFTLGQKFYRDIILRAYWDDEIEPSIEIPIGDFFCNGFCESVNITALPINVNPSGALNCYFPMPFRKSARITIENRSPSFVGLFYTINGAYTEVGDDDAYFHVQFRRQNPLRYGSDYIILDGVQGHGQYVGTAMAWQQNNGGWWGEGEIKIFLDGDAEFPSICGTGTEDYFGGACCFGKNYSAPYLGYPAGSGDGRKPGSRHRLYRFHIMDPIRFHSDIKVTIQALGWRPDGINSRLLPLQDDISSVAYWYQTEPHAEFPLLPCRDDLEVI